MPGDMRHEEAEQILVPGSKIIASRMFRLEISVPHLQRSKNILFNIAGIRHPAGALDRYAQKDEI